MCALCGQSSIMWLIVWGMFPQSQLGDGDRPQRCNIWLHLPCPVRSLFRVTQSLRHASKPGTLSDGLSIRCPFFGNFVDQFDCHTSVGENCSVLIDDAVYHADFLDFNRFLGATLVSRWTGKRGMLQYLFHSRNS